MNYLEWLLILVAFGLALHARHGLSRLIDEQEAEIAKLRAKLNFENREPPHCPTCDCGAPAQIRQLCPECLGYMPCAEHPSTNEKQS